MFDTWTAVGHTFGSLCRLGKVPWVKAGNVWYPKASSWQWRRELALLPVAITLVVATGYLFSALQDNAVARALNAVGLALGLLWLVILTALIVLLRSIAQLRSIPTASPLRSEIEAARVWRLSFF